ncbi:MAG: hypothetical protein ACOZAR_05300 [Patescibacteria group bacterium]
MNNNVEEKFFLGKNELSEFMLEDKVKAALYAALGDYNGEDKQRIFERSWEEIIHYKKSIIETCLKIKEIIKNGKK